MTTTPSSHPQALAMLLDALERSRERLGRALADVTAEQAGARPVDALAPRIDSLAWLVWHTAREIDLQVSDLAGQEALWTSRYARLLDLPLPDDTEDWRHSPEESARVRVSDLSPLMEYLDAAYALARDYIGSLDPATLNEVIDRSWDPPVTRAARLVSIIDDASQHSGQAVWARRLLGLPG